MHLVGYLYEDYHNARSLEHKDRLFFFREIKTCKCAVWAESSGRDFSLLAWRSGSSGM
jgi:hypothetical protein